MALLGRRCVGEANILSRPQAILLVVRGHSTLQANSGRIGKPKIQECKDKEGKRKRANSTGIYRLLQITWALAKHV